MGFSRQGYWSRLPCPLPEDLSNPGIKPASLTSPVLSGGFLCGTQQFPEASLEGWCREKRGCGKRLEVQGGTQCTVQFIRSVVFNSLQPHGLQHARPPCPSPTPRSLLKIMSIASVMPSNHLILIVPFSSRLQSFQASGSFQWVGSSHQVAKILEFQLQHQSFQWIFKTDFL